MFLLIFLCTFFLQINAANDGSSIEVSFEGLTQREVEQLALDGSFSDKNNAYLDLHLSYMPPNELRQFGNRCMRNVADNCENQEADQIIERVDILLKHGCTYNEFHKSIICATVTGKSQEKEKEIRELFECHENAKNVKGADD